MNEESKKTIERTKDVLRDVTEDLIGNIEQEAYNAGWKDGYDDKSKEDHEQT